MWLTHHIDIWYTLMTEFTHSATGIKVFLFVMCIVLLQVHVVRSSDQLRSATCMSWMLDVSYLCQLYVNNSHDIQLVVCILCNVVCSLHVPVSHINTVCLCHIHMLCVIYTHRVLFCFVKIMMCSIKRNW